MESQAEGRVQSNFVLSPVTSPKAAQQAYTGHQKRREKGTQAVYALPPELGFFRKRHYSISLNCQREWSESHGKGRSFWEGKTHTSSFKKVRTPLGCVCLKMPVVI